MKTRASESGQMHPAICGQVIKKKMHRVSAQMYLRATVQDGVSRIHHSCYFLLQKYRSARQSPVQNISAGNGPRWSFRTRQAAATFLLSMLKYDRFFLFTYIEKMAACIFTRSFVWHSLDDRNLSILFPPTL